MSEEIRTYRKLTFERSNKGGGLKETTPIATVHMSDKKPARLSFNKLAYHELLNNGFCSGMFVDVFEADNGDVVLMRGSNLKITKRTNENVFNISNAKFATYMNGIALKFDVIATKDRITLKARGGTE